MNGNMCNIRNWLEEQARPCSWCFITSRICDGKRMWHC